MADRVRRFTVAAIALPVLFLAMLGLARAKILTVTNTTNPASPTAGDGSLVGAILENFDDGGGDTIEFAVTGTIELNAGSGPLLIGANLTINGPTTSPGITIDGQDVTEVMYVSPGVTLSIVNLTTSPSVKRRQRRRHRQQRHADGHQQHIFQ